MLIKVIVVWLLLSLPVTLLVCQLLKRRSAEHEVPQRARLDTTAPRVCPDPPSWRHLHSSSM